MSEHYDVIIIGGSYAGLSAGLTLARSARKVLILDEGDPCNYQSEFIHNFLTQDGTPPEVLSNKAKKQFLRYPTCTFFETGASSVKKQNSGFVVSDKSGKQYTCMKLLFATGVVDLLPAIPGFKEC